MNPHTATELVAWLDSFDARISIGVLKAKLTEMRLDAASFSSYIHFSGERYQRNLLAYGAQYYALVMCWKPGQLAPVHDHRGASCGVRVLQGIATETTYRWADGKLIEDSVQQQASGQVCGSFDDDIHEIRNNGVENLVTLHIYSPCLTNINIYNLETGAVSVFTDPLVEMHRLSNSGAGPR